MENDGISLVDGVARGNVVTLRRRHTGSATARIILLVLVALVVAPGGAHAKKPKKFCLKLCRSEISPCVTSCKSDVAACKAGCAQQPADQRAECLHSCRKPCGATCRTPILNACYRDPNLTRCHSVPPCTDPSAPGCQPALVGFYALGFAWNVPSEVQRNVLDIDPWAGFDHGAGKGHSIVAEFKDLELPHPDVFVALTLETLWTNGYAEFVNMPTSRTAAAIANGAIDDSLRAWADGYAAWVGQGGGRRAFLAPLQEMNNPGVPYGVDPDNFKRAYAHIQDIFAQAGVTRDQVWWVFAPVGYTWPGRPALPAYYPGDDKVDVIAFSAYNFGTCDATSLKVWQEPDVVFGPYVDAIREHVSATKPIFIAQTATTSQGGDKDQWMKDAYKYLVQENVRGVLWFNVDNECDWAFYVPDGRKLPGYAQAVTDANTVYVAPADLGTLIHDQ